MYLCVMQADAVRHCLWEDCFEACAQGAVEDRNEQPGEDYRPAAGQRYLCKLYNIQYHQSYVCLLASAVG